jgi:hypothetical protein
MRTGKLFWLRAFGIEAISDKTATITPTTWASLADIYLNNVEILMWEEPQRFTHSQQKTHLNSEHLAQWYEWV